jgi:prepilin-type N-terminal cleavage/methylation domain-containing protein
MTQRASPSFTVTGRRGFTLIELLVVIGIIILLLAILLPVAGRVKIQAQTTKTQATIAALASAIERYFQAEHAYPGLYTNDQLQRQGAAGFPAPNTLTFTGNPVGAGRQLTQTENMVLSLAGGLEVDPAVPSTSAQFGLPKIVKLDATTTIGKGPISFASAAQYRARTAPYFDPAPGVILPQVPYTGTGFARRQPEMIGNQVAAGGTNDTGVPEPYDNYGTPRPIIYMRANVGAPNICSQLNDPKGGATTIQINAQYMSYELNFYKRGAAGAFPGDFLFGNTASPDFDFYPGANTNDPTEYLRNPNIANTPRNKDKFILISAGADRCFGTRDDIFYGGN